MIGNLTKNVTTELLQTAGITINGNQPWDIQIHNKQFYHRVSREGALGLGEAYMDHWWDCTELDELIYRILRADFEKQLKKNKKILLQLLLAKLINFQTKRRALDVGKKHYDIGNQLFHYMLDSRMNYTCGYWKNADNLEDAQLAKLDLVCRKLLLQPGMRLLDIGCGWGGFAKYAAEKYGVTVVGITISKEQVAYAQQYCAGLPIEIYFQDYRDIHGQFDRIASLGMFEHVGHLNHRTYLQIAHDCLTDDGLFLLHTIGSGITYFKTNEWIDKYIFPNGVLPSIAQIGKAIEGLFIIEDLHNFGADYDKTLKAWYHNFTQHWEPTLKAQFDERFYRMWTYYLLSCAGGFRARDMQLWQIVLSKKGITGGYQAAR